MRRNFGSIALSLVVVCLLLAVPVYGQGGGCAAKADTKSSCVKSGAVGDQAKPGCSKPCTKPCATPCGAKGASATAIGDAGTAKLSFGVAYLSCDGCAGAVKNAIKLVNGVQSVAVDYRSGVADVEFDTYAASSADIIQAVEKAGYHAQVGPYSDKELAEFAKDKETSKAKPSGR